MQPTTHALGWNAQLPDFRDYSFHPTIANPADLPLVVQHRDGFPEVYNQFALGSCVLNALAGCVMFDQGKQGLPLVMPSRLFLYWNTREGEGSVPIDSGCEIRDAIKVLNTQGACPETDWPYVISEFTIQPPATAYTDGLMHRSILYQAVEQDEMHITSALASGYPIIAGITLYASFESEDVARTGIVPMPQPTENLLGGHGVVCCGIDRTARTTTWRNSWGADWGDGGYFTLPLDYMLNPNLCSDLWIVEQIT